MKADKVPVLSDVSVSDLAELVFSVMMRMDVMRRMDPADSQEVFDHARIKNACYAVMLDECEEWE